MKTPFTKRKVPRPVDFKSEDRISRADAASLIAGQLSGSGQDRRQIKDTIRKAIDAAIRREELAADERGCLRFNDVVLWAKERYPASPAISALTNDVGVNLIGVEAKASAGNVTPVSSLKDALGVIEEQQEKLSRVQAELDDRERQVERDRRDTELGQKIREKNRQNARGPRNV